MGATITYTTFTPSLSGPFQFQPTLDGNVYNAVVTWPVWSQRWYISVSDLFGNLLLYRSVCGSPVGVVGNSATWDQGFVTLVTTTPHGYLIGSTINLSINGFTPDAYNGVVQAFVNDSFTLTYPLTQNPGAVTGLGSVYYNLNLVGGYFNTQLVYRTANQQFETWN